jgi:hypothetical protein
LDRINTSVRHNQTKILPAGCGEGSCSSAWPRSRQSIHPLHPGLTRRSHVGEDFDDSRDNLRRPVFQRRQRQEPQCRQTSRYPADRRKPHAERPRGWRRLRQVSSPSPRRATQNWAITTTSPPSSSKRDSCRHISRRHERTQTLPQRKHSDDPARAPAAPGARSKCFSGTRVVVYYRFFFFAKIRFQLSL